MTENGEVPIMQQLYDDAVYANRNPIDVDKKEGQPGEGGGSDEFSNEPTAGLLDTFSDEAPGAEGEAPEETPPEEGAAPPPAPAGGAPAPAAG